MNNDKDVNQSGTVDKEVFQHPVPPMIVPQDIRDIMEIIDMASKNGAIPPSSLTMVGRIYDKLTNFLDYIDMIHSQQEEAESDTQESDSDNNNDSDSDSH